MSVLPILRWPNPALKEVCTPVPPEAMADMAALAADMLDTMYDAPGRGLAAPQVGVLLRMFVMDVSWKDGAAAPMVCINPQNVEVSDETAGGEEGCLSIPGVAADVVRPAEITLRFTDLQGAEQQQRLTGAAAKCAQHELDHLNGLLIFDRLPEPDAEALRGRYEALEQAAPE